MSDKTTITERADNLKVASRSGYDLSNMTDANWKSIGQVINGFAKKAKDDSLNVNPSVLFIKSAQVLKDSCNVSRLPDNVANELRNLCNAVSQLAVDELKSQGYVQHSLSKTKARVDMKRLSVGTSRNLSFRRDNWTLESQLTMLNQEIRALEKKVESKSLDYKDTEKDELQLEGWNKLARILKQDIADAKSKETVV